MLRSMNLGDWRLKDADARKRSTVVENLRKGTVPRAGPVSNLRIMPPLALLEPAYRRGVDLIVQTSRLTAFSAADEHASPAYDSICG